MGRVMQSRPPSPSAIDPVVTPPARARPGEPPGRQPRLWHRLPRHRLPWHRLPWHRWCGKAPPAVDSITPCVPGHSWGQFRV